MRKDLVLDSFETIREELFEDVIYTPVGGSAVGVRRAIAGVEPRSERFEVFGEKVRTGSHVARAAISAFPNLKPGDLIDDGARWRVIDFEPIGDGRCEVMLSLSKVA
jgi:hypothetical protein